MNSRQPCICYLPDVAVLEPTGVNYSKLWVTKLAEAGVKIALVGHRQLRSHRIELDLPDKDDQADALALACYYLSYSQFPSRFVRQRDEKIAKIREIALRLHHLARVQSPIVNRAKQDLAWQFPEVAKIKLTGRLFWGWLAGERHSVKYDNLLKRSAGSGLTVETQLAAKMLCQIQERERVLERSLRQLIVDPRFSAYRRVFARFGFGQRVEAIILSQIYPFSNYLVDGKPEVKIRQGKISGKPTKRHINSGYAGMI